MEYLYVNFLKRPSGRISLDIYKTRQAADQAEDLRSKGHCTAADKATRVACIRVNVNTLCVEGRYDV